MILVILYWIKKLRKKYFDLRSFLQNIIDAKSLRITFNNVDEFIRDYAGNKYLVLFGLEEYDAIYDMIIYLIELKYSITYVFLTVMRR